MEILPSTINSKNPAATIISFLILGTRSGSSLFPFFVIPLTNRGQMVRFFGKTRNLKE